MELNLKILAPLLQYTSIYRCVLFMKAKKKNLFYSSPPIKKLLNFLFHSVPLYLSLSLSLSLSHSTLILSQSLSSHRRSPHHPKPPTDRLTVPSRRSPIASPSHAADCLTVTLLSANPAHRPTPSTDPARRPTPSVDPASRPTLCLCLVIVDFVYDC